MLSGRLGARLGAWAATCEARRAAVASLGAAVGAWRRAGQGAVLRSWAAAAAARVVVRWRRGAALVGFAAIRHAQRGAARALAAAAARWAGGQRAVRWSPPAGARRRGTVRVHRAAEVRVRYSSA